MLFVAEDIGHMIQTRFKLYKILTHFHTCRCTVWNVTHTVQCRLHHKAGWLHCQAAQYRNVRLYQLSTYSWHPLQMEGNYAPTKHRQSLTITVIILYYNTPLLLILLFLNLIVKISGLKSKITLVVITITIITKARKLNWDLHMLQEDSTETGRLQKWWLKKCKFKFLSELRERRCSSNTQKDHYYWSYSNSSYDWPEELIVGWEFCSHMKHWSVRRHAKLHRGTIDDYMQRLAFLHAWRWHRELTPNQRSFKQIRKQNCTMQHT